MELEAAPTESIGGSDTSVSATLARSPNSFISRNIPLIKQFLLRALFIELSRTLIMASLCPEIRLALCQGKERKGDFQERIKSQRGKFA